jgi:hypothetical protein
MPNPFPGMDPYLEGDLWMSAHTDLCAEIARQLAFGEKGPQPVQRELDFEPAAGAGGDAAAEAEQ